MPTCRFCGTWSTRGPANRCHRCGTSFDDPFVGEVGRRNLSTRGRPWSCFSIPLVASTPLIPLAAWLLLAS